MLYLVILSSSSVNAPPPIALSDNSLLRAAAIALSSFLFFELILFYHQGCKVLVPHEILPVERLPGQHEETVTCWSRQRRNRR
jgi:hypothetical protein